MKTYLLLLFNFFSLCSTGIDVNSFDFGAVPGSKTLFTEAIHNGSVILKNAESPICFFNVKDYGAKGDSIALDNSAINNAIEACSKAGGGTVFFPAGKYLSGSIRLKSFITLYLDAGATIFGAPNDINAYDPPEDLGFTEYQDFGHSHWHNSLIWGENLENISIIGQGKLHGGGMTSKTPPKGGGNKTIALKSCKNILIRDLTIEFAGHFAILPTGCDNMTIDNLKIDTQRDGINIDCCTNVRISNCSINAPKDDGLVLKSSYALGYNRATENVTITNCTFSAYDVGSMLNATYTLYKSEGILSEGNGRFKCGTESNGGFKNIVLDNCVFKSCRGINLAIVDGGTMENVTISNITMRDIANPPIFIRLGNRAKGPKGTPVGRVRNIDISNVTVSNCNVQSLSHPDGSRLPSNITGIPGHPIENVRLNNIRIVYRGEGHKDDINVTPIENETGYPEPTVLGRKLPAYGFYCRHIQGMEFHNVSVAFENDDPRPSLFCDDVEKLEIDNFNAKRSPNNDIPVILKNVKNIVLHNSFNYEATKLEYKDIKLTKDNIQAGIPFSLSLKAISLEGGLGKADLFIDSQLYDSKYTWVDPAKPFELLFSDIYIQTPGKHIIKIGDCLKKVTVD